MNNQTIAAISTPLGPGGIGIIRISGPDSYSILKRLFVRNLSDKKNNGPDPGQMALVSHQLYYGHIVEPIHGNVLDEVLAVYMKAPKSFTREDVVEIHSHSGFVVLDRLLSAVVDSGAVLSGPGEFSKRAFLNGRIDLSQAEAVVDLINAPCETAVQMAGLQMAGGLKNAVEKIISRIMDLRSHFEANIEFSDDTKQGISGKELSETLQRLILPKIDDLIQNQKDTAIFREGALLSIAGVPNVGKSSLLNRLAGQDAAIVTDIPGTTRDILREHIQIDGLPLHIIDTAGLRDSDDVVEQEGVKRAKQMIEKADQVLFVVDINEKTAPC